MVSEGYTWVGRRPTLELEILAFLIRELVADISDDEVQRLLELRFEKKAHEKCETCQSPHQRARPLQVS